MYVGMRFFKVKSGKMDELRNIYVNHIITVTRVSKVFGLSISSSVRMCLTKVPR